MSNPTYTRIAEKANIRLSCKLENMTYSVPVERGPESMVIVEAFYAEVFIEIDPATAKADEPAPKQDLEAARKELADAIVKAKARFEQSTGTTLTAIEPQIVTHCDSGSVDMSVLLNVGVTAMYSDNGAEGAVWSTL